MKKLEIAFNKTLKLTNVLSCRIKMASVENVNEVDVTLNRLQNIIRVKGANQVGPVIQHMRMNTGGKSHPEFEMSFYIQCDRPVQEVEQPYTMIPVLRVPNCIYCRYIGPESKQNFAYDKIFLEAYERDIPLTGDTYTILVNRDEQVETVIVDVFMERADG